MIVNGQSVPVPSHCTDRLLDTLRDRRLTGAKEGCGVGECGACTVLVDGRPVCSCLVLTAQVADSEVVTVEGLADRGHADLQAEFVRRQAVQCGYCIPGVLVSCSALLEANPRPTRTEVAAALDGNLCRCTGYQRFADAIEQVSAARVRRS